MDNISELLFYSSGIIILLILLILSALISGCEAALFSLSSKQISLCAEATDIQSKRIISLLDRATDLLATIIVISNFVNITFVIFGNYMLWRYFGKDNITKLVMLSYTFISAALLILFGELIPKMYASHHNMYISKKMSGIINFCIYLFKPFTIPLIKIGNIFGKTFTPEKYSLSPEELNRALELTVVGNNSEEDVILKGIATFGGLYARQIMRPRTDITAIDIKSNFIDLMSKINQREYSRLPVYQDNIDSIKGTIYTKDLIPYIDKGSNFKWQSLLRDTFFIPETKKLDSLLLDFKEKRIHIAIVVDEYGGTSGLVTMEDVIEKIIGNVAEEIDSNEISNFKKIDKYNFIFPAKVYLNDFCKAIGQSPTIFDEVKGESESLAGLLLEINGKLPQIGKEITCKNFKFIIVSVDQRRIKKIKVQLSTKK
ncbi:MAG: gliding motility-associated protein GldE [Bacteroidetes bacterium]|nr:gliding motility-associated protein GldE [Bacteroidota bacterium]